MRTLQFLCVLFLLVRCGTPLDLSQSNANVPVPTPVGAVLVTGTGLTRTALSWTAATDESETSAGALEYKVVYSTTEFTNVSEAEVATTGTDWTAALTSTTVASLSKNTSYYFGVLVRNSRGGKSLYPLVTSTTKSQGLIFSTFTSMGAGDSGLSTFDSNCESQKPGGVVSAKAIITDGSTRVACTTANCSGGISENVDWPLLPSTTYLRIDGATTIGTTDASGVFSFNLTAAITGTIDDHWTGLSTDWTAGNTCTGWSSTAGNGCSGRGSLATNASISRSCAIACSASYAVYCAEL